MFRTLASLALVTLTACSSGLQPTADNPADLGDVIEGEFIISADLPESLSRQVGLVQLDFDLNLGAGLYLAEGQGVSRAALEATLKENVRDTLKVEHNRPVSMRANDPYRYLQWNMDMLEIETAWEHATGDGVTVAVIDSGASFTSEDRPARLIAGWDYVDNDGDPRDLNGHGTHVAGTIAQATGNGLGVVGVAPDASILVYRVLDAQGYGSAYWTAKAISDATDAGADVINMSLGSRYSTSAEANAIRYAADHGVVLVAASGNDGRSQVDYPGAYPETIAVGAVRYDGRVTNYSNGGSKLDIVAPGGDTGVDQNGDGYADGVLQEVPGGYEFYDGTSMASPHVAGAAALLLSAGAAPEDVRDLLTATADDIESPGWDLWSGYGVLNVVAALETLASLNQEPEDTTGPVISGVGGERSGNQLTLWWTTDEPATTELEFEEYGWFGNTSVLETSHEMKFTIDPSQAYRFTIVATDAAGNRTTDGVWVTNP